ncbi:MAG: DUF3560 domain-containing protein [Methanoregula sp.]|jgi:vacuolar-type H+-ATPase subunit I/STV1|nr:DUF3560 domain-containing protein [Methanoregula sp.]
MTLSNFHEKRDAQIDRCRELADKNAVKADELHDRAHKMADVIPFGQPILVGHYSEKSDRNYRARITNTFDKSMEAHDKSKYYSQKADRLENNKAISQDDPDAIESLQAKLKKCEEFQEQAKTINKIIRKKIADEEKVTALIASGLHEETARKCLVPDYCNRIGIPAYALTNNNANMNRIKKRIAELQKNRNEETIEREIGDLRVVDSVEENRIMIFFPGKPDEETRKKLKSAGFRWSPTSGAWQAYRNNRSRYYIDQIVADVVKKDFVMPAYVNPEHYQVIE